MVKLRLVSANIQLELVADDGEVLDPVCPDPIFVLARDWPKDIFPLIQDLEDRINMTQAVSEENPQQD